MQYSTTLHYTSSSIRLPCDSVYRSHSLKCRTGKGGGPRTAADSRASQTSLEEVKGREWEREWKREWVRVRWRDKSIMWKYGCMDTIRHEGWKSIQVEQFALISSRSKNVSKPHHITSHFNQMHETKLFFWPVTSLNIHITSRISY